MVDPKRAERSFPAVEELMFDVKQRLAETSEAIKMLASMGHSIPPEAIELEWGFKRLVDSEKQLAEVAEIARRHAHPGCNAGAHALAVEVLRALGVRESIDTSLLDGGDE